MNNAFDYYDHLRYTFINKTKKATNPHKQDRKPLSSCPKTLGLQTNKGTDIAGPPEAATQKIVIHLKIEHPHHEETVLHQLPQTLCGIEPLHAVVFVTPNHFTAQTVRAPLT